MFQYYANAAPALLYAVSFSDQVVGSGIIIILLYFILGWNLYISFLIGTAVAAAIIFSQVWKSRSGLSAIEFYRARKYRKSTAKLVWKSDEYNQARKNYLKKEK